MPVLVLAALLDEDHLVHAGVGELLQMLAHLFRRADAAALADIVHKPARRLETLPDPRHAGLVLAEDIVMAERIAEIAEAVRPAPLRLLRIMVDREAGAHRDIGVDRMADGHAFLRLDDGVVFLDPLPRHIGVDEREGKRADAGPGGGMDRLHARAGYPERRMRASGKASAAHCGRAWRNTAPRSRDRGANGHHVGGLPRSPRTTSPSLSSIGTPKPSISMRDALSPVPQSTRPWLMSRAWRCARRRGRDGCRAAAKAPLHGRAGSARCCARRRREDFRGGGVRILLKEMMLVLPYIVETQPVGELPPVRWPRAAGRSPTSLPSFAAAGVRKAVRISCGSVLQKARTPASIAPLPWQWGEFRARLGRKETEQEPEAMAAPAREIAPPPPFTMTPLSPGWGGVEIPRHRPGPAPRRQNLRGRHGRLSRTPYPGVPRPGALRGGAAGLHPPLRRDRGAMPGRLPNGEKYPLLHVIHNLDGDGNPVRISGGKLFLAHGQVLPCGALAADHAARGRDAGAGRRHPVRQHAHGLGLRSTARRRRKSRTCAPFTAGRPTGATPTSRRRPKSRSASARPSGTRSCAATPSPGARRSISASTRATSTDARRKRAAPS